MSSEISLSLSVRFQHCLNTKNPFSPMFRKLTDLLLDSNINISEILQEVYALHGHLTETLREKTGRVERARCSVMHEMKNALTGIVSCAHVLHHHVSIYL